MSLLLQFAVVLAALLFIGVSAAMNAIFLSSLGRTPTEVALLAAVSLAADVVKAALPVVIVRALSLRAWLHGAVAALMLAVVVTLSLASGTGFAALTRSSAVAARGAQADALAARTKELEVIEASLARLPQTRPAAVIDAEIAAARLDRRWHLSKSCTETTSTTTQKFCVDIAKARAELAAATALERLTAERRDMRARIEGLQATGAGVEADPQSGAIAALLGVDASSPRRVLTVAIAVALELGSVLLVLLWSGPTLRGWREPGSEPLPPTVPAKLPEQADRAHWRRQHDKVNVTGIRGEGHART